jgi:hypothetical protein
VAEVAIAPSLWRLRADLAWAHGLLWVASAGRDVEPRRNVHLYLADRYGRLSDLYAKRGLAWKAKRFGMKSEWHYRAAGPDNPPRAAAIAMPAPSGPVRTDAIGAEHEPEDVA